MLDYEKDVKQFAIDKLAGDVFGKGRIESAIYHTFMHVYQKGIADGEAHKQAELEASLAAERAVSDRLLEALWSFSSRCDLTYGAEREIKDIIAEVESMRKEKPE